jgi:hypothetical protein
VHSLEQGNECKLQFPTAVHLSSSRMIVATAITSKHKPHPTHATQWMRFLPVTARNQCSILIVVETDLAFSGDAGTATLSRSSRHRWWWRCMHAGRLSTCGRLCVFTLTASINLALHYITMVDCRMCTTVPCTCVQPV